MQCVNTVATAGQQGGAVRAELPVGGHVGRGDRVGPIQRTELAVEPERSERLADTPREVHRGRTRRPQLARRDGHVGLGRTSGRGERDTERAGRAERRGTPDGEVPDRVHHLGHRAAVREHHVTGESALVDESHDAVVPCDRGRDGIGRSRGHGP